MTIRLPAAVRHRRRGVNHETEKLPVSCWACSPAAFRAVWCAATACWTASAALRAICRPARSSGWNAPPQRRCSCLSVSTATRKASPPMRRSRCASAAARTSSTISRKRPVAALWHRYRNLLNLLLTALGMISYATEDLTGALVIALMVLISTLLNFIRGALQSGGRRAEGHGEQHRHGDPQRCAHRQERARGAADRAAGAGRYHRWRPAT